MPYVHIFSFDNNKLNVRLCLDYYTPKNATADNLTVTLKAIVDVFADATVELGALKGKSHDIIFAGVDAGVVVTVSVIAQIVANVILVRFVLSENGVLMLIWLLCSPSSSLSRLFSASLQT